MIVFTSGCALAIGNNNIDDEIRQSDVVVIGRTATSVKAGRVDVDGVAADVEKNTLRVSFALKGTAAPGDEVEFTFLVPDHPMGYHGVPSNSDRILFLQKAGSFLQVTDPYQPSLPACSDFASYRGELREQIIQGLAAAVACQQLPDENRLEALDSLRGQPGIFITSALSHTLAGTTVGSTLRLSLISELLRRNDIAVLPEAVSVLRSGGNAMPRSVFLNMSFAVGQLHDERAVPELSTLLKISDVAVRRSAVTALRNAGSPSALAPLAHELWDSDSETRYGAVIGLADITGQSGWRPLESEFRQREDTYLEHWRNWSRESNLLDNPR